MTRARCRTYNMHLFSIKPAVKARTPVREDGGCRQWTEVFSVSRLSWVLREEVDKCRDWKRLFFLPPHRPTYCHISLLIAITRNLPCCLNIHSLLIKRGSLQVDGIKSFLFPPIAAHLLRLAHDCSRPAPAEDCVTRLWVWEHKSRAPVSYDARLWSAASRGNCQPIHHNNKRPRDSAPSAQVLHVLLHSNT